MELLLGLGGDRAVDVNGCDGQARVDACLRLLLAGHRPPTLPW